MLNEQSQDTLQDLYQNGTLSQSWQFYEGYFYQKKRIDDPLCKDYTYQKIIDIKQIKDMINILNYLPHGTPSKLFKDEKKNQYRFQIKNEKFLAIDNLYIFRENIKPEWEDPKNQFGCEYQQGLNSTNIPLLDQLWQNLIVKLVCEEFPHSNLINGLRFTEKQRKTDVFYRLDIWLSQDLDENNEEIVKNHAEIQQFIQNEINNTLGSSLKKALEKMKYSKHQK